MPDAVLLGATVRGRFGRDMESPLQADRDAGDGEPGPMGTHLHLVPFIGRLGLEVENMTDGRSRIRMPHHDRNLDEGGRVHEGPVLALLDTTGAMAAWSITGYGPHKASTVSIQAQMLDRLPEKDLTGYGRVVQRDRELFWIEVEIASAPDGQRVARGTVIYRILVREGER